MKNKTILAKRMAKSTVALALCAGMMLGSFNISTGNTGLCIGTQNVLAAEDDSEVLLDVMLNLNDSVRRLTPAEAGVFTELCGSLTKGVGIFNGVTAVLKMTGLMEDPTAKALGDIQATLNGMNADLKSMNSSITNVENKINQLCANLQKTNRTIEINHIKSTSDFFFTNYTSPLNKYLTMYENYVNTGFETWFNAAEKAAITTEDSITIPSERVTLAMQGACYNVNGYHKTIIDNLTKEVVLSADQGKLEADSTFYDSWKKMTSDEKNAAAAVIAEQAYNSLAVSISKKEMETHTDFVIDVMTSFNSCCTYLKGDSSVLKEQLKGLFLTHGFEGEVRDQIIKTIDQYVFFTGTFGTLAMTVGQQNGRQKDSKLNELASNWQQANNFFRDEKAKSITGYDNYCYLTGDLVTMEKRDLNYWNLMYDKYNNCGALHECSYQSTSFGAGNLLKEDDVIVDSENTMILYELYKNNYGGDNNTETVSFDGYLDTISARNADTSGYPLVTEFNGWFEFNPSEGIAMDYGYAASNAGRDYWGDTFKAKVNTGNKSGVDNKYFVNCQKATGAVLNFKTGRTESNQVLGAMAAYAESHSYWIKDEMYLFGKADQCSYTKAKQQVSNYEFTNDCCDFSSSYAVLVRRTPEKKVSIQAIDTDDSALKAPAQIQIYSGMVENQEPEKEMEETETTENAVEENERPENSMADDEAANPEMVEIEDTQRQDAEKASSEIRTEDTTMMDLEISE